MGVIKLIEIVRKIVKPTTDNRKKVYFQDVDNLYPNRIKGLIENSPTAFRSAKLMAKFIVGKGLKNEALYDLIIDNALNLNVYNFGFSLAKSLSYQNGFFVHISYKYDTASGNIIPSYSKLIPFEDSRISRSDDDGYLGKLYVKEWDNRELFSNKSNETKEYYSFTKKQDEIIEQIKHNWKVKRKDKPFELIEAIQIFNGQYYYYNSSIGDVYPLSNIHPVMNDCDTEYRIGNYTNGEFRKGMLGKVIVQTNGLTEEQEDETYKVFQNFMGDENSSDMVFFPANLGDGQTFEDAIKVTQLKPQYDEKFISETIPRLRRNIMASFNNIPEPLVMSSDSALFGTSGETYSYMKKFYSDQCDEERYAVSKFFKDVYDYEVEFITFGSDVVQLNTEENA